MFLRGKQLLAQSIRRLKIKGTGPRKANATANLPNLYALPFLPEEYKQTNLPQISLPTQEQKPQRSHTAAVEVPASPQRFSLVNLLSGASALRQNLIPHGIQAQALSSSQANPFGASVLLHVPAPKRHLEQQRFQESAHASSTLRHADYRLATGATLQATLSYAPSNFLSTSIEAIARHREILRK
jgi:hypothetical protein